MAIADSDDNSFVKNIMEIIENAVTITGETSTSKIIEALLLREDRYNELGTGITLQIQICPYSNSGMEKMILIEEISMKQWKSITIKKDIRFLMRPQNT